MNILLHICCGPCTLYPLKILCQKGLSVTGFFFNPNIHPFTEFYKRVEALKSVSILKKLPIIWHPTGYGLNEWMEKLEGEFSFGKRCLKCYEIRLEEAAQKAKELKFDLFSTTLLYSKYQLHEAIKEIGLKKGEKYKIKFYYEDFRLGWKDGINESIKLGIYRQAYCGCIFSEAERYSNKINKLNKEFVESNGGVL